MVNTSGDPENEHLSDGFTDELIGVFQQGRSGSRVTAGRIDYSRSRARD
jgi:TolB-like protein